MCSPGSLKSFPVTIQAFTLGESLIATASPTPPALKFNWTPVSGSAPTFLAGSSLVNQPDRTTLVFGTHTYAIESVQICKATHNTWIVPSTNRTNNPADVIITFVTSETIVDTDKKYIIFVLPLVKFATASNEPAFLRAMTDPAVANKAYSIQSLFTTGSGRAYGSYSSCFSSSATGGTASNALVIVSFRGIPMSDALLLAIKQKTGNGAAAPFPELTYPEGTTSFQTPFYDIPDTKTFTSVVSISMDIGVTVEQQSAPTGPQEESLDAYKCVTIDPDTDVSGGKLYIDPATGKPLTNINKARTELAEAEAPAVAPKLKKAIFTRTFAIIVTTVVTILLVLFLIMYLVSFYQSKSALAPGTPVAALSRGVTKVASVPAYVAIAVFFGAVGFLAGALMPPIT